PVGTKTMDDLGPLKNCAGRDHPAELEGLPGSSCLSSSSTRLPGAEAALSDAHRQLRVQSKSSGQLPLREQQASLHELSSPIKSSPSGQQRTHNRFRSSTVGDLTSGFLQVKTSEKAHCPAYPGRFRTSSIQHLGELSPAQQHFALMARHVSSQTKIAQMRGQSLT
ncbi:unnamed protein product, partial [Polarella glacialis]